jgi:cytochrome c oxidase assembly protein Cox11
MMAMTDERQRQQRAKNRALLAVLLGLVVLFYVMALVKMGAF